MLIIDYLLVYEMNKRLLREPVVKPLTYVRIRQVSGWAALTNAAYFKPSIVGSPSSSIEPRLLSIGRNVMIS